MDYFSYSSCIHELANWEWHLQTIHTSLNRQVSINKWKQGASRKLKVPFVSTQSIKISEMWFWICILQRSVALIRIYDQETNERPQMHTVDCYLKRKRSKAWTLQNWHKCEIDDIVRNMIVLINLVRFEKWTWSCLHLHWKGFGGPMNQGRELWLHILVFESYYNNSIENISRCDHSESSNPIT